MLLKAVQRLPTYWRRAGWTCWCWTTAGDGDAQLSVTQRVVLDRAVVGGDTIAQRCRTGMNMFGKVGVPVLGLVQTWVWVSTLQRGGASHVFGKE